MVILDTNIIIDHLRLQKGQSTSLLMQIAKQKPKEVLGLSVLSVQELYEGQSTKDTHKEQYLLATISPLKILPYTYETAKLAGEIAREIKRPIELADSAIAATTILNNGSLLTINKRDFGDVPGLRLADIG